MFHSPLHSLQWLAQTALPLLLLSLLDVLVEQLLHEPVQ
jgi:hypothetical protein